MTNVLIGIIGVILFIGLSLAGALYLGPRFHEAQNNSTAMAVTQAASQVSSAANLYRVESGFGVRSRVPASQLRDAGYLRAIPMNPFIDRGGRPYRILNGYDIEDGISLANIVLVDLGGSAEAREICGTLNRQALGDSNVDELELEQGADVSSMIRSTAGCFRMHDVGVSGEADGHDYIAYSTI